MKNDKTTIVFWATKNVGNEKLPVFSPMTSPTIFEKHSLLLLRDQLYIIISTKGFRLYIERYLSKAQIRTHIQSKLLRFVNAAISERLWLRNIWTNSPRQQWGNYSNPPLSCACWKAVPMRITMHSSDFREKFFCQSSELTWNHYHLCRTPYDVL